jgi:integrase
VSTLNKVLATLRAAINWGMAQDPAWLGRSPFHRFGVRLNRSGETKRDRRIPRDEEWRLLNATALMCTWEHWYVGPMLHDRIIGALELLCRRGEMLLIQNKRVYWDTYQIGIPGRTAKDQENRRIPFDPEGRLAQILEHRAALGPEAYVFGTEDGRYQGEIQTAWETLRLLAHGYAPRKGEDGTKWNREQLEKIDLHWHDLRHEGASRLLANGVDIRVIQLMLGHASLEQTQRYLKSLFCSGEAVSTYEDPTINMTISLSGPTGQIGYQQGTGSGYLAFGVTANATESNDEQVYTCYGYAWNGYFSYSVQSSVILPPQCDTQEKTGIIREYYNYATSERPGCGVLRSDYSSVYFSFGELNHNGYHSVAWIDAVLLDGLDEVRNFLGRPFTLSNAYRCPDKNHDVGSNYPATSRHMFGRAADMIPVGEPLTQQWRDDIAADARATGAQTLDEGNTVHMEYDH